MSSGATFTEVRLGIKLGGYIHPVRWQIVDTRRVAPLLILPKEQGSLEITATFMNECSQIDEINNMTKKANAMIKTYNYLKAVSKRVLGGFENVDESTYYDRVHTCSRCEWLDQESKECNKCGCPVETKAAWKTEECPIKKW